MMTKSVIPNKVSEKRGKWAIFEELHDTNEMLDEAVCILDSLKQLVRRLPDKWTTKVEQTKTLVESAMILGSSLEGCSETTGVLFGVIEMKLDEMLKSLLHDEAFQMHLFSKLASEVSYTQKRIDALIAKAEEDIYKFLEYKDLYTERQERDFRIMELVFGS